MHACWRACVMKNYSYNYSYTGKLYDELGSKQEKRKQLQICNDVKERLSIPLTSIGLTVDSIKLKSLITAEIINLQISSPDESSQSPQLQHTNDHIPEICYLLTKYNVSISFYHELTQCIKQLPRSHKVCSYIASTIFTV